MSLLVVAWLLSPLGIARLWLLTIEVLMANHELPLLTAHELHSPTANSRLSPHWLLLAITAFVQSEAELLYDWQFTANQFVLVPSLLSLMTRVLFFFFFATEPLQS
jgi:hypothetical protein